MPNPTDAPSPASTVPELWGANQVLDGGTYRIRLDPLGPAELPPMLITVREGFGHLGGWGVFREDADGNLLFGVMFWDVAMLYGHPCQWRGTLFDPGPTVDDLVEAIVDIPLRNATEPIDVTLDGYAGKYVEWSVPADIETEPHGEYISFDGCDLTSDGDRAFESWTGRGWATDRYQQGPGQVDRLWILDVDGFRLVIDATYMPAATAEDREQLQEVVESIRFER